MCGRNQCLCQPRIEERGIRYRIQWRNHYLRGRRPKFNFDPRQLHVRLEQNGSVGDRCSRCRDPSPRPLELPFQAGFRVAVVGRNPESSVSHPKMPVGNLRVCCSIHYLVSHNPILLSVALEVRLTAPPRGRPVELTRVLRALVSQPLLQCFRSLHSPSCRLYF